MGPLEKSSTGHQYVLVVCDYATRYPEAFPFCITTMPKVIHALIQFFSRVGIPDEILTVQETNFTSHLMKQLGIIVLKTSPYHPKTAWHRYSLQTWGVNGTSGCLLQGALDLGWETTGGCIEERGII